MVQCFTTSSEGLSREFSKLTSQMLLDGMLLILWPKKSSGGAADLDENIIWAIGLSSWVVDVKVIATDDTCSGLKFVDRIQNRSDLST